MTGARVFGGADYKYVFSFSPTRPVFPEKLPCIFDTNRHLQIVKVVYLKKILISIN